MRNLNQAWMANDVIFAEKILGLPLHKGQIKWFEESYRKINILRPGNRWGKSFSTAIKHIRHAMTKQQIRGRVESPEAWLGASYETLNFGPGYEQAREVLRLMVEIVEGKVILPKSCWDEWGKTNESKLAGWAIKNDRSDAQILPDIQWINGSKTLGRSYSDMGAAFKAKAIAYISGDECGDIAELWRFTNATLLPRLVSMGGQLDFVGTIQSESFDYLDMIERAEIDMEDGGRMMYVQRGSMYENEFLDQDVIRETEEIADEDLRQQIIYGEHVESGEKYFGHERISQAFEEIEQLTIGLAGRKYLTTVDFAGGESRFADRTVIKVIDYTKEPYRVVYIWSCKGNDVSIPMQYKKVEEVFTLFPGKLIIDGSALGGKNAKAFLKHLRPIVVDIGGKVKAEMLAALKIAFDGSTSKKFKRIKDESGIDLNDDWGIIKLPKNHPDSKMIKKQFMNYKLDDKKIRTDFVMTLAQAIWWIELKKPKMKRNGMMPVDWASII